MQKQTSSDIKSEPLTLVKDYATDPNIEVEIQKFLKVLNSKGGKPMEETTPAEARRFLEDAQTSVKTDVSGIDIIEKTITQDKLSVELFIIRPSGMTGILPVFMFFHGGGWMLVDFSAHKRFVRDLVVHSGLACVFVEYTRSPEAKYPTALHECYAGTKWVSEHGSEINVDGKRMAVVGNSAGGNLTAAVSLMAKENNLNLKFQLLFWPVTNTNFETESYDKFATLGFLTKNMMKWFWDNYAAKKEHRNEIYASPLKAPLSKLKGLPPTLVQIAENDVLRDEGEAYARNMDEAGVPVTSYKSAGYGP